MSDKTFKAFRPFSARPPAIAIDRFGRRIEEGHTVLISAPNGLLFEVVSVGPVLNPSIPKDQTAVQVMVRTQFPSQFIAGQPIQGMVVIGETEQRQKAKAEQNGMAPAAEEEPGQVAEPASAIVLTDEPVKPAGE
jgi:hypothetical protein